MHIVLAVLFSLLTAGYAQAATYVFSGNNYVNPEGTLTTSMRVTGSFTTFAPLPPNMPKTEIGPKGSNLVQSWNFHDGINTYTKDNSVAAIDSDSLFSVSTDADGNIAGYHMALMGPLPPHTLQGVINVFNIRDDEEPPGVPRRYTRVFDQGTCANMRNDICTAISRPDPPLGGSVDYILLPTDQRPPTGTFATQATQAAEPVAVPTLGKFSMLLLATAVAGLAWRQRNNSHNVV